MEKPNFTKPILLRKMEQLYQIEFEYTAYICSIIDDNCLNEYCLVSADMVRKTAMDKFFLNELKFDSIIEALYQTSTGKFSKNFQKNQLGFCHNLTLVLSFNYAGRILYLDIQNQLFREMFDFTEASILADADLKKWLEENSNFHYHILFLSSSE